MPSDAPTPVVELKNVTKRYGNVQALKGIRLRVDAGEVVACLRPNGAGKSTAIALGIVPIGLIGLFLGFLGSTNVTSALSTTLGLLLSFASGYFIPLS